MGSFQMSIFLALCGLGLIHGTVALSVAARESKPTAGRAVYTYPYTCPSILVGNEDTCDDLALKCGISAASFTSFNPDTACSSLPRGKPVCCATGTHTIPPDGGGNCYAYTIRYGDTCKKIAEGYKITVANIETWNINTTAWYGCNKLQEGGQVCLSAGDPLMPVAIAGAVCGPQVPGTARPLRGIGIAALNPCPAGQCCSTRGQCGTGPDFCGSSAPAPAAPPTPETKAKSAKTTSATSKATSAASTTKPVTLTAKDVASTTKNKNPHFFTTDIPLVDVPLTYLHATTSMPAADSTSTTTTAVGTDTGFLIVAHKISMLASRLREASTSTTKTTSSTTSETSTTKSSPASATQTVDGIVNIQNGWSLKTYDGIGCTGSYVLLQGHNKYLEDSDCMQFGKGSKLETLVKDTAVSCHSWTIPESGNWEWTDCHKDSLDNPTSWRMSNGLCTVSPNDKCDLVNDISQTYGWRGPGLCQDRQLMDPKFGSMKCYVG
ncbi:uncharacterized protein N7525_010044 [Penicillium rubens]|uniref:uncharacterized protein n=1 Tax=Penicillium rubens TaxID=1108849 RepID=UPI002A59FF0E|nr:uncharacterized protein N7525_010044 [Penicillium rubens]KAJ5820760.1 hypothetical protein N7525_010044 [Penicillium rubens]